MKTIIIFIFTILLIESCITVHCPGYDLDDYSLISYRQGDSLIYISDKEDTLKLSVQVFYSIGPQDIPTNVPIPFPLDYWCDYDTYYQTDCVDGISIKEHLQEDIGVKFGNDEMYKPFSASSLSTETINCSDTTYLGLKCDKWVGVDLTNKRRISRFTKVEFFGIIDFYDRSTGLTWKLVDFPKKIMTNK